MLQQLWLNKREGVISVLVLIAVLLLAVILLLSPVSKQVEHYRVELARDARILQQLRAIDNARDALQSTFEEYQSRNLQSWVYSSADATTAAVDIQRRVAAQLSSAAAQVRKTSPLPARTQEGYSVVGVQVDFTASMLALMEVLSALEQEQPLLIIDNVRIAPVRQSRIRRTDIPDQFVAVQMTVLTYVAAEYSEGDVQ